MKLIISLLEYFAGATTLRKFPRNNMFWCAEAAIQSCPSNKTIKIAENPEKSMFYKNRFH